MLAVIVTGSTVTQNSLIFADEYVAVGVKALATTPLSILAL